MSFSGFGLAQDAFVVAAEGIENRLDAFPQVDA
jgi:hypothetical protein